MKKHWAVLVEQFGHLSPGNLEFVDRVGLHFERQGISRIGSRILGMLMVTEHPIPGEMLAERLLVSRASVSTNARQLVSLGYVELITVPGDRRDYYVFAPDAWIRAAEAELRQSEELLRILREGEAAVLPQRKKASARLRAAIEFRTFHVEQLRGMLARWRRLSGAE